MEAWGDHVLGSLPPKAKALFGAGRFVSVEDGVAVFALPSVLHRDKCNELRATVEETITTHLGARIRLQLVAEAPEPARASPAAGRSGPGRPDAGVGPATTTTDIDLGEDDFDPDDPGEPVEIESIARTRLLEAFPGAEEVGD